MNGKIDIKDQSPAIQSACSFYIYTAACDILKFNTKEERRQALATLPDMIRPHVQAEAEKLWRIRHANSSNYIHRHLRDVIPATHRDNDL